MLPNFLKKFVLAAAITAGAALSPLATLPVLVATANAQPVAAATATVAALPAGVVFAQGTTAAPAAPAGETVHEESLWQQIMKFGFIGKTVILILFISSILVVWFGIDCIIKTTKARAIPPIQLAQLRELFKAGDYTGAYNYAKANFSPLCDTVRAGVTFLPDGKTMTEEAVFNEINRINGNLMGRVSYLSVIGVCAPMVGLLGTVSGMRDAFGKLATSGAGDTSKLSESIGEVLIATAFGLFVAIPAFVLYYVMRNRISVILHTLQEEIAKLFRKMPYELFEGTQLGDEEIVANTPNWAGVGDTAGGVPGVSGISTPVAPLQ
ncbi:MAG: MotA/TolQ/ExbB proton channel family protein [Puniceicoccales bacterium]|jgi:biopolymer transport protein ExbB|nr:MotA/TolQ/ExbB proton channel family protein [Puniceicoccales bacterium]